MIQTVPQAARLSAQKFGKALRLLRNIGMWKDVLAMPLLEELALDNLLNSKILPHLRTLRDTLHDAVTRTERVMAALDGTWLGSSQLRYGICLRFVRCIKKLQIPAFIWPLALQRSLNMNGIPCSPKLTSFVEYMTTLTRLVEKKRDGGASAEDSVGLARRVKVMLVKLNEYDRARQLAKHFQLREAL